MACVDMIQNHQENWSKLRHTLYSIPMRIQDLGGGGPASQAKCCWCSTAESCKQSNQFVVGFQGLLKDPESFWVFNAQICIFPHSRDSFSLSFWTASSTLKTDTNSTLHCTSINLRIFLYIAPIFLTFMEKLCFLLFDLMKYAKWG